MIMRNRDPSFIFFFFNDTATTEIYTLSLHDALPIYRRIAHPHPARGSAGGGRQPVYREPAHRPADRRVHHPRWCQDRKSTRLNSSHSQISYAVFCLKKKQTRPRGYVVRQHHYHHSYS